MQIGDTVIVYLDDQVLDRSGQIISEAETTPLWYVKWFLNGAPQHLHYEKSTLMEARSRGEKTRIELNKEA